VKKSLLAMSLLTATIVSGAFSIKAFARPSNGNTINHTNVNNSLDSNRPININRNSNGEVKNPDAVNTN
jgi:hypothetical protein